jgi:hypothetical protein
MSVSVPVTGGRGGALTGATERPGPTAAVGRYRRNATKRSGAGRWSAFGRDNNHNAYLHKPVRGVRRYVSRPFTANATEPEGHLGP